MNRRFAIRRLLAILVVAGLVLAPFSRPLLAAAFDSAAAMMETADQMADMSMSNAAMSDDMPCCPSKAPAPVDCDKCVFMIGCTSACVVGLSAAGFEYIPIISVALALPRDGDMPAGLGQPPPERPPRILV